MADLSLSIFSFKDPVNFLQAHYELLKTLDPGMTVRRWSVLLGISSPEILVWILKRKNKISLKLVPSMIQGMNLSENESKYFEMMVRFSRAITSTEKENLEKLMKESLNRQEEEIHVSSESDIFSHWIYSAILEICSFDNDFCDKQTIMDSLGVKIPEGLIDEAIGRLLKLNLLNQCEDKGLRKYSTSGKKTSRTYINGAEVYPE